MYSQLKKKKRVKKQNNRIQSQQYACFQGIATLETLNFYANKSVMQRNIEQL